MGVHFPARLIYVSVFFVFCFCFAAPFAGGSFFRVFSVFESLWGPRVGHSWIFFVKSHVFSWKGDTPRFCTLLNRFGSILRVWDFLESSKNEKKQHLENHAFLSCWKEKCQHMFYHDFRVSFWAISEVQNHGKIIKLDFTMCFVIWGFLGFVWDYFWLHFAVISGLLLKWFGGFSVMFLSLGSTWGF